MYGYKSLYDCCTIAYVFGEGVALRSTEPSVRRRVFSPDEERAGVVDDRPPAISRSDELIEAVSGDAASKSWGGGKLIPTLPAAIPNRVRVLRTRWRATNRMPGEHMR